MSLLATQTVGAVLSFSSRKGDPSRGELYLFYFKITIESITI